MEQLRIGEFYTMEGNPSPDDGYAGLPCSDAESQAQRQTAEMRGCPGGGGVVDRQSGD